MDVFKKIISSFLMFLLTCSAVFLTFSFLIKWNLKEDRVVNYTKQNDLSFILKTKDGNTNDLLKDTEEYLKKIGIPSNTIDEVINSESTHEFVGIYTYKILNYAIHKNGTLEITKNDILNLVKNNFPIIAENIKKEGKEFSKSQQEEILSLIDRYSSEVIELFPTVNTLIQKINREDFVIYHDITLGKITKFLGVFTGKTLIYSLCSILIFSFLLLVLINYKKMILLIYIRLSILFYSFFFIIVEVLLGTVIKDYLMSEWESANSVLNYFVNVVSKNLWVFILIGFFLSICITMFHRQLDRRVIIEES